MWTAEEWFRTDNTSINESSSQFQVGGALPMPDQGEPLANWGVRDTADFTIENTPWDHFNGQTIKKWQNFNWFVEINPRTGKAIRKQYNWGRGGWEGGAIADDNKTVYLGDDATPGIFAKFVANTAGDFTDGDLYFHKYNPADPTGQDPDSHWRKIDNTNLDSMLHFSTYAKELGASFFCRVEWVAIDRETGKVYFTETGNDNINLSGDQEVVIMPHTIASYKTRFKERYGMDFGGDDDSVVVNMKGSVDTLRFKDYYGRVSVYDPATGLVETLIEGGPYFASSPEVATYPAVHMSNPDGLGYLEIEDRRFLMILEDLNGRSFGRSPSEYQSSGNVYCEMYLLDLEVANPTPDDLVRLAVTPFGAEITGAKASFDGKTIFFNCQHPSSNNPFPYNNSVTLAVSGLERAVKGDLLLNARPEFDANAGFQIWPNPVARELYFNKVQDVALYDIQGKRLEVFRNVARIDVSTYAKGTYFVRNAEGQTQKLVVE
ncbi:MAG: DUF839 domain-containing protein [Cytophagales bacterium]|nr:DUF839 domain-containing protein [Cytophagales bacterium]